MARRRISTRSCGARNLALCIADSEKMSAPVERRRTTRTSGCGTRAISRPTSSGGLTSSAACRIVDRCFVYFKHEEQGLGPEFARRFIERLPEAVRLT